MEDIENKDEQKKIIVDELFKKFENEFEVVLMDFQNNDKAAITEAFIEMGKLAINPYVCLGEANYDKEIQDIYLNKLVKTYKKRINKAEQMGLKKYFILKEILSQFNEIQINRLRQLELISLDINKNDKLSFEIFGGFIRLVVKFLEETLPELYLKDEPAKTGRTTKPGSEYKIQKLVTWKGTKVDFIKLIYALYISNQIDHKKGVTVIAEELAQVMGVNYFKDNSDLHKSIADASKNGYDLFSFFDELQVAFQSYVDSEDKAKFLKS